MKKSFSKALSLIAASLVLFTACKKEETGGGGGILLSKRLTKMEVSSTEYSTYEYNTDGLLSKATEVDNGTSSTLTLTYGADKKLVEALSSDGNKLRPVYAGNKFDTLKIYDAGSGGVPSGFIKYEYTNGKNTKQSFFAPLSGTYREIQRTTLAYSAAGDVTSHSLEYYDLATSQWKSGGRTEYTKFDNKTNPSSLAGLLELAQISGVVQTHNVLEEKEYNSSNVLVATSENTYTYDGDGYPTVITEKRTPASGAAATKTTKYTYTK